MTVALLALGLAAAGVAAHAAEPVRRLAAGSLRAALTELAAEHAAATGRAVVTDFGPSGLLRDRILGGERADVFASANLDNPQTIADEHRGEVRTFARNTLCGLAQPDLDVTPGSLLEVMLREDMRVGISTPVADPAGDYAFALFDRAEAVSPGVADALKAKALRLTGGADSPQPPEGRSVYAWVMEEDRADVFLTYRTNAVLAVAEAPDLRILQIPPELNVGADYGLVVLSDAQEAEALASHIIPSSEGQAILERHGFEPSAAE